MNRQSTASGHTLQGTDKEKALEERLESGPITGEIIVSQEITEQWNAMPLEKKLHFEKKLLWKLDLRLIPWLSLLYLLSFLDRTNIGNAKIQGVRIPSSLVFLSLVVRLSHSSYLLSVFYCVGGLTTVADGSQFNRNAI
jgi:hypothetical protein